MYSFLEGQWREAKKRKYVKIWDSPLNKCFETLSPDQTDIASGRKVPFEPSCNLQCSCHQWFAVGGASIHSVKKAGTLADSNHLSTAGNNPAFPPLWSLPLAVMHLFCSLSLFSPFAVGRPPTMLPPFPRPVSIMTSWDCVVFWHFAPAEKLIISLPLRWWCRDAVALRQFGLSLHHFFFSMRLYIFAFPIWLSPLHQS